VKDFVFTEAAWDSLGFNWIQIIHQVKMKVRRGGVAGMADIREVLPDGNLLSGSYFDRPGLGVGKEGKSLGDLQDDMVARQRPEVFYLIGVKRQAILDGNGKVTDGVDRISLGPSILRLDHRPIRGGVDGLSPAIAVLQRHTKDEVTQRRGTIEPHPPRTSIRADKVVGIPLPEHVCPMARDFFTRSVGSDPFASERKFDDNRRFHAENFSGLFCPCFSRLPLQKMPSGGWKGYFLKWIIFQVLVLCYGCIHNPRKDKLWVWKAILEKRFLHKMGKLLVLSSQK